MPSLPDDDPLLCTHDKVTLVQPENYRALAQNFYGVGGDRVTIFNFQYHWARRPGTARYLGLVESYPFALSYLRDLWSVRAIRQRPRHYRFHPLHGGPAPTGAIKDGKILLSREVGSRGEYRLRLCELLDSHATITITLSAQGLTPLDEIELPLNHVQVVKF